MVKKKVNKKVSKSEPFHYKNLNFNKKIISVVLIVLAIGVIGSIFPGEGMTGNTITDTITDGITGGKTIIQNVVPISFTQDTLIYYERIALFLLLFALLSAGAKAIKLTGATNLVVAGALSFISTFFIPASVLTMIGVTYSSIYASLLILIPVLVVGYIAWVVPKTKGGRWVKTIIYFILWVVFTATTEGLDAKYATGNGFETFVSIIIFVLIGFAGYNLYKALFMSTKEEQKAREDWQKEETTNTLAGALHGYIIEDIKGASEALVKARAKGREPGA